MKSQRGSKFSLKSLFSGRNSGSLGITDAEIKAASDLSQSDLFSFGAMSSTVSDLLRAGTREARDRRLIYDKWAEMEYNPFVSSALALQTTAALGGHESTGEVVFVETKSELAKDPQMVKIAEEVSNALSPLFNRIAFPLGYTASAFGDSYCRLFGEKGVGVTDIYTEELVRPQLVQPYERGSKTVG